MRAIFKIIKAAVIIGVIIFLLISCSRIFGKMGLNSVETYSYKQILVEEGKYARINSLGEVNGKDAVLVSFLKENGYSKQRYFVAWCEKKFLSETYENQMEILGNGSLFGCYEWQGEHVLAVNDIKCERIRIVYSDSEEMVEVGKLPFVYFAESGGDFVGCEFLDAYGEILN